ncbi:MULTISPECIES: ABC1 kinase family protein [Pseudonocardia]|uniref:AarF/ABC1/UbiB kinase family protein n=1 Tax=Pseudonocardia abyssalis TaxID=2792008 RepID=A0ABS6V2P6_9PSEU|nr:AarF/UbiB family protein [Pseudonocardia abyssalis]MBW0114256.1 AarF/ABC1/UbiB kinase family protein [Pseudonocardia abyssalis]MBW0138299.1 AarF/ABC1/UbiB kinase family protein [Pseudonocardia abyssalis]
MATRDRVRLVARVLAGLVAGEVAGSVGIRRGGRGNVDGSRRRARAVRAALEDLGPLYIKVGQMLSTRPDLCPPAMIEEFQNLHEQVTVRPFADFEPVLEANLGPAWREMFAEIKQDRPLGAASLAQVYKATLRNGEDVVLKIQRPAVREAMQDDMVVLQRAVRMVAKRTARFNEVIDMEAILDVIFTAMRPELDFRIEAENMELGRPTVARFDRLRIPEVVHDTPQVLVQTVASGGSIRDVNRDRFADDERDEIGRQLLAWSYRSFFVDRVFHADPHPGNVFVQPGSPAYIIDWGMVGKVDTRTSVALALLLLNMALNDGAGFARSWLELGRATTWADLPGFASDVTRYLPTVGGASMDNLNLGVSLTNVLRFATARGVATSPMIALITKSFANIDGCVRYLAPHLSMVDVFQDELNDILFAMTRDYLSPNLAIRTGVETLLAATEVPHAARTFLADVVDKDLTFRIGDAHRRGSLQEDRADMRARRRDRALLMAAVGGAWALGRGRR